MAGGQWTFVKAINPRTGGMHIFGGAFAGMIAMIIYTRIRKVNGWLLADGALMGLLIGQGIGRFGNLVNIELYGPPTGSNWFGILVPQQHRIAAFQDLTTYPLETRFHPTMLYEAFWLFLSFGIVYYLFRNFQKHIIQGVPTGLYFLLAGFGRFIIEFFRPDQPGLALPNGLFLSYSRIVTLVYMIVGIVVLIDRLGYFRIPFIARPQSMKQREKAYDEMLRNRRRKERATEKEKAREERRKARATQGAQKSVESDTEEK